MTYEFCTTSLDNKILTVTINRPEAMNALHPAANAELAAVFDAFASDPDQWVAIITGAGERAFSAGNDLKFQASGGAMSIPDSGFAGLTISSSVRKLRRLLQHNLIRISPQTPTRHSPTPLTRHHRLSHSPNSRAPCARCIALSVTWLA